MPNVKVLTSLIGNYVDVRIPTWFADTKVLPEEKETIFDKKAAGKVEQCGEMLRAIELAGQVNDPRLYFNAWMNVVFRLLELKKEIENYENAAGWNPVAATAWSYGRSLVRLFGKTTGMVAIEEPLLLQRIDAAISYIFKSFHDEDALKGEDDAKADKEEYPGECDVKKGKYFSYLKKWMEVAFPLKLEELAQQKNLEKSRQADPDKQTDFGFAGIQQTPEQLQREAEALERIRSFFDAKKQTESLALVWAKGEPVEFQFNAANVQNVVARFAKSNPQYVIRNFNKMHFYMPPAPKQQVVVAAAPEKAAEKPLAKAADEKDSKSGDGAVAVTAAPPESAPKLADAKVEEGVAKPASATGDASIVNTPQTLFTGGAPSLQAATVIAAALATQPPAQPPSPK